MLFAQAAAGQLLTAELAGMFSAVVVLSMATTPFLMRLTDVLDRYEEKRTDLDGPEASPETPVIVVGYGRFGQTVGQMLMAKSIGVTIIDLDAEMIDVSSKFGWKVYYGDGTRVDLLRLAGAAEARAILFCTDGESLNRASLKRVLEAISSGERDGPGVRSPAVDRFARLDLDYAHANWSRARSIWPQGACPLVFYLAEIDRVEEAYRLRDCKRAERSERRATIAPGGTRFSLRIVALADPRTDRALAFGPMAATAVAGTRAGVARRLPWARMRVSPPTIFLSARMVSTIALLPSRARPGRDGRQSDGAQMRAIRVASSTGQSPSIAESRKAARPERDSFAMKQPPDPGFASIPWASCGRG